MSLTAEDDLIWITLSDFTPGVITNSDYALSTGSPVPGNKLGQAQSAVGCIALPNGGLAPLPKLSANPIPPGTSLPSGTSVLNGLFVTGPIFPTGGGDLSDIADAVVYGILTLTAAPTWYFTLYEAYIAQDATLGQSEPFATGPDAYEPGIIGERFNMMTGGLTTIPFAIGPLGSAQVPIWAFGFWYPGNSPTSYYPGTPYEWLFPDPTDLTATAPYDLQAPVGNAYPADVLTHQNRIVLLSYITIGAETDAILSTNNEVFNYTDPPNSITLGVQNETFVSEHPVGVGAWGSLDSSELFLVKNSGGAYIISGDLNNPTVTRLPTVVSTLGVMSRVGVTPIGIVYASNGRGLWTWNGGSSAQKISEQLEDDFFVNPNLPKVTLAHGTYSGVYDGPSVDICAWGDWIIVSNDWLYDSNLGGWWQLPPGTDAVPHLYYGIGYDGNTLYASPVNPTDIYAIDKYFRDQPTDTWTWASYPIRQGNKTTNRQMGIREIVCRAQGTGTVQVTLNGINGSFPAFSPSETMSFGTDSQPVMQRVRVGGDPGGFIAQDVTVEIVAVGFSGGPAPIVYEVSIGYIELSQPVNAT